MQMKTLVEMENSGLVTLLRDDKYDDLARMYSLFRRVDSGSALIRTVMSDHVKEVGKQLVQDPDRCKVRAGPGSAPGRTSASCISGACELERLITLPTALKDPVEFVTKLLDERDKYERILVQSFKDDKAFRTGLNQVCHA